MCRAPWKNEPLLKCIALGDKLDPEAVQMYLDWLYTRRLDLPATLSRRTDAFNLVLLKCWAVACAFDDKTFRSSVLTTFFAESRAQFWLASVEWVFAEGNASSEIKAFVLDVFMAFSKPGWFKTEAEKWPQGFVREVGDRALENVGWKRSFERIRREWMRELGAYGVEERKMEVVSSGGGGGGVGAVAPKRRFGEDTEKIVHGTDGARAPSRRLGVEYGAGGDGVREVKRTRTSGQGARTLAVLRPGAPYLR
jgi:hypothetical protein